MIRYTIYCFCLGAQCAFVAGDIATNGHPNLLGVWGVLFWLWLVWTQMQLLRDGAP